MLTNKIFYYLIFTSYVFPSSEAISRSILFIIFIALGVVGYKFITLLKKIGFKECKYFPLTLGVVALYVAIK